MDSDSSIRVGLLIFGVILIIVGAGLVVAGYNQMQAADAWASQPQYCGTAGSFQDVGDINCPSNPYSGGEERVGVGTAFSLLGGVLARAGTK